MQTNIPDASSCLKSELQGKPNPTPQASSGHSNRMPGLWPFGNKPHLSPNEILLATAECVESRRSDFTQQIVWFSAACLSFVTSVTYQRVLQLATLQVSNKGTASLTSRPLVFRTVPRALRRNTVRRIFERQSAGIRQNEQLSIGRAS
jgi:hypothetical protein